jgi:hypothetical protein
MITLTTLRSLCESDAKGAATLFGFGAYSYGFGQCVAVRVDRIPDCALIDGATNPESLFKVAFLKKLKWRGMPEIAGAADELGRMRIGPGDFPAASLRKIADLPGVEIADGEDDRSPLRFRFAANGCGLLMPLKPEVDK